jgi:hypothetical protein
MIGAHGAVADERPVVSEASPYVSNGVVVCDVRCGGLFSEQIVGTVKSGLPAVVELLYSYETRDGDVVGSGIHSFELRYDVWEDVYSVVAGDSTTTFGGFEAMRAAIERLHDVSIVREDALEGSTEYAVMITVAVHPLTGSERRRLEGFVEESVGARSHDSWREQVLNINDLISRFFSRDKGTSNRSDVFRTDYFARGELPGSSFPVDGGGGAGGFRDDMTVAYEVR